jgi:hypothetical protein
VYTRCLDGEYFRGARRARDGYSNPTSIQVAEHVTAVRNDGAVPSLEALADRGFDGELVIVVQFAAPEVGAVDDA